MKTKRKTCKKKGRAEIIIFTFIRQIRLHQNIKIDSELELKAVHTRRDQKGEIPFSYVTYKVDTIQVKCMNV